MKNRDTLKTKLTDFFNLLSIQNTQEMVDSIVGNMTERDAIDMMRCLEPVIDGAGKLPVTIDHLTAAQAVFDRFDRVLH